MDNTQENVVALRDAYIDGDTLRGVTADGTPVHAAILRGAANMQVGDIYNTPDCHYKVESIKE